MNTATYYAKVLYELGEAHPEQAPLYLKNLRAALRSRGHEKLLPRIWSEFQKLDVQKKRTEKHRETTPEIERTDKLLQLYHRLVAK
jgi:hypothetical protein